ncbi:hypothetical protein CJ030_MR5G010185 [Morella rubra]|uniref:GRF-type domain-containing protein n=1 Tax=Morella rubra TaxID=262757 RepID=A0A6A1VJT8_9ROSI|nr:hypothetical protein CJ030_MR5G010185 [Morella rubra]
MEATLRDHREEQWVEQERIRLEQEERMKKEQKRMRVEHEERMQQEQERIRKEQERLQAEILKELEKKMSSIMEKKMSDMSKRLFSQFGGSKSYLHCCGQNEELMCSWDKIFGMNVAVKHVSSSNLKISRAIDAKVCSCGLKALLKSSWTNSNPGRRFFGCENFDGNSRHCNYFCWFDHPTYPRGMEVGRHLTKKIKVLENERDSLKHDKRSLKMLLWESWIAIVALGVALMRSN